MDKGITVSTEEELKLRKSFDFGAYLLITHYLVKTYGIDELERFARFWGETGASPSRRSIVARSKQEFRPTFLNRLFNFWNTKLITNSEAESRSLKCSSTTVSSMIR